MSDNIWRDEFMHHRLASEAEARERKQSDTPETDEAQFGTGRVSVDFARRLERERDEARNSKERFSGLLKYLSDKVPSEGGKEVGDAIDSIVQERDQLRKVADELRVNGLLGNSDRAVSAVESYNKLPHVIERKDPR